jgi:hypothetical protein
METSKKDWWFVTRITEMTSRLKTLSGHYWHFELSMLGDGRDIVNMCSRIPVLYLLATSSTSPVVTPKISTEITKCPPQHGGWWNTLLKVKAFELQGFTFTEAAKALQSNGHGLEFQLYQLKVENLKAGMVVNTCNLSTWKAEVEGDLSLRRAWAI